jgi:DNA-directed RNA polymerase subunit RPC12/RpoP
VFPVTPVEIPEPEPEKLTKDDEDIEQVVDSETTQASSRELKKKSATVSTPTFTKPLQVEKKKGKISTSSTTMSSISKGDEIRCPSCGQRLKVPYDRRPITAKCPRCETKFMAEKQ